MGSERSAARRRPKVRSCTSLANAPAPSSSASVPSACRRVTSIWKRRSCAWVKPCRYSTSRSVLAAMCGMPSLSRTTLPLLRELRWRPSDSVSRTVVSCARTQTGNVVTTINTALTIHPLLCFNIAILMVSLTHRTPTVAPRNWICLARRAKLREYPIDQPVTTRKDDQDRTRSCQSDAQRGPRPQRPKQWQRHQRNGNLASLYAEVERTER